MTTSSAVEELKKLRKKRDKKEAERILKELPKVKDKGTVAISISKRD